MKRRIATLTFTALCVAISTQAYAFEFDEHAEASRLALEALATLSTHADRSDVAEAMIGAREILTSDTDPQLICSTLTTTGACLHLGDISGIAGDLSSSPGGMFFSHFSDASTVSSAGGSWNSFLEMLFWLTRSKNGQPGAFNASSIRSNATKLPNIVRSRLSGETCGDYYFRQNLDLDKRSQTLLKLAALNNSHFELRGEGGIDPPIPQNLTKQDAAALFNYLPMKDGTSWFSAKESAYAYYTELHGLAVLLASRARSLEGPERKELLAMALVNELYALHYLQDLYAPGHRQQDSRSATRGDIRKDLHDCFNKRGAPTVARNQKGLCALASSTRFPLLNERCSGPTGFSPSAIFGDGQLICTEKDPERLALQFIAALSLRSLLEVYGVDKSSLRHADVSFDHFLAAGELPEAIRDGFVHSKPAVRRFVLIDENWQTQKFAKKESEEPKTQLLQKLFAAGYFEALPPALQMSPDNQGCRQ